MDVHPKVFSNAGCQSKQCHQETKGHIVELQHGTMAINQVNSYQCTKSYIIKGDISSAVLTESLPAVIQETVELGTEIPGAVDTFTMLYDKITMEDNSECYLTEVTKPMLKEASDCCKSTGMSFGTPVECTAVDQSSLTQVP